MKKNGFIATSILYSLVALLALVMLIVVNNYATIVKLERDETKDIKEKIYNSSSDVIISWKYPEESGISPDTFPQEGSGFKVTNVECTPDNGSEERGTWKDWKLVIDLSGVDSKTKVRCTVTLEKE